MQAVRFLREFLRHPQLTGTFFASTDNMADVITDWADLSDATSIVELGSGNGVFTRKIMEKRSAKSTFFALEVNPHFVRQTKQACPQVDVYADSAIHIKKYLHLYGLTSCDVIISALPWAAFKRAQQIELLDALVNALRPGGRLVSIAYVSGRHLPGGKSFRKLLESRFETVEISPIVWRNRPPAIVYRAYKAL